MIKDFGVAMAGLGLMTWTNRRHWREHRAQGGVVAGLWIYLVAALATGHDPDPPAFGLLLMTPWLWSRERWRRHPVLWLALGGIILALGMETFAPIFVSGVMAPVHVAVAVLVVPSAIVLLSAGVWASRSLSGVVVALEAVTLLLLAVVTSASAVVGPHRQDQLGLVGAALALYFGGLAMVLIFGRFHRPKTLVSA